MQRRLFVSGLSAVSTAILTGCGGGGGEAPANPVFPAYAKGGAIVVDKTTMTITFDLSQGHLLGLATKDLTDPTGKKDDPTRRIMPTEVKEVVFASATLGGTKTSPARTPWNASGVVVLPNTAGSDGEGWFFVILKTGEEISLAMSPDKARYTVTGNASIVVGTDGSLTYGDYRLGKVSFLDAKTVRIHFGADVLGGLSGYARPGDVAYGQWNSDDTGWLADGTVRSTVQADGRGDAYIDFAVPSNDQGTFTFRLKDGRDLWFDANSKRWESLGGMEKVAVLNGVHLRYGGYRKGSITHSASVLQIDFAVDLFHSLVHSQVDGGTDKVVIPLLADIAYVQWISELTHWYDSPAKGVPVTLPNGDYRVDIGGMPNNDRGYVKVFLKDGRRLSLNPRSTRFVGSQPLGITML